MHHCYPMLFEEWCPCLWVSGGSENDLHTFINNYLYMLIKIRIEERYIHREGLICSSLAFLNMFPKNFRIHASGTNLSQCPCIAYSTRKLPSARPDHTGLDNGDIDLEEA